MADDSIIISPGWQFRFAMLLAIAADALQIAIFSVRCFSVCDRMVAFFNPTLRAVRGLVGFGSERAPRRRPCRVAPASVPAGRRVSRDGGCGPRVRDVCGGALPPDLDDGSAGSPAVKVAPSGPPSAGPDGPLLTAVAPARSGNEVRLGGGCVLPPAAGCPDGAAVIAVSRRGRGHGLHARFCLIRCARARLSPAARARRMPGPRP